MKYKGIELKEITEPQIFDPPKKMLVWNNTMDYAIQSMIVAIVERMDGLCAMCYDGETYPHCTEIPEEPKPRRATKQEFARWIAQGKGEWKERYSDYAFVQWDSYREAEANEPCSEKIVVRKWDDTEWHEPTVDYMGIE